MKWREKVESIMTLLIMKLQVMIGQSRRAEEMKEKERKMKQFFYEFLDFLINYRVQSKNLNYPLKTACHKPSNVVNVFLCVMQYFRRYSSATCARYSETHCILCRVLVMA